MTESLETAQNLPPSDEARPETMSMTVQSGMLRTLGINLYTSLGKVLVEFVANAYDSDATKVEITIPEAQIKAERERLRAEATAAAKVIASNDDGQDHSVSEPSPVDSQTIEKPEQPASHTKFDVLMQVLPPTIEVVITDDGHGMTWQEVRDKFLPVNRQRRKDESGRETRLTTPKGRHVMGRKGVGKLAGFGAAMSVQIRSKRRGEAYATIIVLSDEALNHSTDISSIPIPVTYEEPAAADEQGTTITLRRLKSDALRESLGTIEKTIAKSFHAIRQADFAITINEVPLISATPDYEFVYPSSLDPEKVKAGELASDVLSVSDIQPIPFRYFVGFLPRSQHLKSAERGARVYCNNRLAAGPTLFDLGTGMHSFHSTDYMECVVEADELDRDSIDLINTARTQFKEGNEVVDALRAKITMIMHAAIAAHGKFRDEQAKADLETDPKARIIMQTVKTLPNKSRKAATKLLTTLASQWGVGTDQFEEIAPTIVHSINATDVLMRLVSKGASPDTIGTILEQLRELSEIEKRDTLKLYRGRRGAIEKLEDLAEKGLEQWRKRASEKALHALFKECPWLIRPEFSNYIASDNTLTTTVSKISRELKVDEFADAPPPPVLDGENEDTRRPDLVFVMSDPMIDGPHTLKIVELKSPSIPLTLDHYRQLEDYITTVKRWCSNNLAHPVRYHGYLIGAMPKLDSKANAEFALLEKYRSIGPKDEIQVLGLNELIRDARTVHVEAIRSLQKDLEDEDDDGEVENQSEAKVSEIAHAVDPKAGTATA